MKTAKTLVSLVICSMILIGCGDKDDKKSPSQVLAKVNGKEITVLQLNYLLAQQPKADNQTKQTLLDSLIEQELLVQKAEELKLDRNPDVLQGIEFSKKQLLAQAAVRNLVGRDTNATDADVTKYYNEHSELFSDRKIFELAVFLLKANDMTADANTAIEHSATSDATREILENNGIKYQQTEAKRPAEQIPLPVLEKLVQINIGDIVKVPDENGNLVLMQLIARTPQPVSQPEAEPAIKQLLQNQQIENKAKKQIDLVKAAAKIEYLQRFSEEKTTLNGPANSGQTKNEHLKSGLKGLN